MNDEKAKQKQERKIRSGPHGFTFRGEGSTRFYFWGERFDTFFLPKNHSLSSTIKYSLIHIIRGESDQPKKKKGERTNLRKREKREEKGLCFSSFKLALISSLFSSTSFHQKLPQNTAEIPTKFQQKPIQNKLKTVTKSALNSDQNFTQNQLKNSHKTAPKAAPKSVKKSH